MADLKDCFALLRGFQDALRIRELVAIGFSQKTCLRSSTASTASCVLGYWSGDVIVSHSASTSATLCATSLRLPDASCFRATLDDVVDRGNLHALFAREN